MSGWVSGDGPMPFRGKTTISEGFPTTFRRCSEDFRRVSDDDQRGCRPFPKMVRRFPEDFRGVPKMFRRFPEGFPKMFRGARGVPEGFWEGGAQSGLSGKSGALPGRVGSAGGTGILCMGTGLYFFLCGCSFSAFSSVVFDVFFYANLVSASLIGPFVPRGTKCCSLIGYSRYCPRILLSRLYGQRISLTNLKVRNKH